MPVSRMRMRPWLEQKIESNAITGLHWVDKDKTTFSIPWKHAARHGWEMDKDASLFKQWAIHTGKYVEGQNCDPKTWKANFRCAMNSLPDIEEVKDRSVNKGHQAMRVFRMLPTTAKSRDNKSRHKAVKQRRKSSAVKMEEDTDYSDTLSPINASTPEDNSSTQENTVDSTMRTEQPDFTFMAPSEVPDWSSSVEISGVDFSSSMRHRFEVSPEHSFDDDFDYTADVIKICEELERGPFGSLDDMGFLTNEACSSPGSQWSDTSSASDLDEPQYTTLVSDLTPRTDTDNLWNNFCSQLSPML